MHTYKDIVHGITVLQAAEPILGFILGFNDAMVDKLQEC
jgi:hypothetical protein